MAYLTGTANSFNDLLSALRNACTTNGWTLSGEVLTKGTIFIQTRVGENSATGTPVPPANSMLIVRAGTGIDGGNLLTGASHETLRGPRIGRIKNQALNTYPDFDWPIQYFIHINTAPDEVVMVINYNGATTYQLVMFGQSPAPGNPGLGTYVGASVPGVMPSYGGSPYAEGNIGMIESGSFSLYSGSYWCPLPFWQISAGGTEPNGAVNGSVHGVINSSGVTIWSAENEAWSNNGVSAAIATRPLLDRLPNAWNNESILLPFQLMQVRPSSKSSLVAELKHFRVLRNDFIEDKAILTFGPDSWKVYPVLKKNAAVPDGGQGLTHSGTFAFAVRYDGP